MANSKLGAQSQVRPVEFRTDEDGRDRISNRPLVSVVVPAYNEAPIVENNLSILCQYMESLEDEYCWEIIFVNDGSTDETRELAERFARNTNNIYVLHHIKNFGLGQALKFGFEHCRGDYIVTLDLDLSYSPDHIRKLLTKIRETKARIVVASPYMKGGKISNVPWFRRRLSIWANRFLSITLKRNLCTLTGMVRVYDRKFLNSLNLMSQGMEINPEIIYKAMLLHGRVEEVPAHLEWQLRQGKKVKRRSSMRVLRHTISILVSGFVFRPVMFFIIPGLILLLLSLYANFWMFVHLIEQYQNFPQQALFPARIDSAVAAAFKEAPHTFIVGGMTLMLAIQLISLGILALQSKRYFEEIFHLGTTIYKYNREGQKDRK